MASPLMESIVPYVPYKGFTPEQMQREQTRRAAQKIQKKAKAIESYTNVKNNISASLAKSNSLLR